MALSEYAQSFTGDVKLRYLNKISLLNNVDPYTLKPQNFSFDRIEFPRVSYIDIVNYVVFEKSAYSKESMKAYKSLDAYKYFQSGFVKRVGMKKFGNNFLVMGKVRFSVFTLV